MIAGFKSIPKARLLENYDEDYTISVIVRASVKVDFQQILIVSVQSRVARSSVRALAFCNCD